MPTDTSTLARQTQAIDDRNAVVFDRRRSRDLFKKGWRDRSLTGLPADAKIHDMSGGAGEPVGAYITAARFTVTGVDAAPAIIAIAQARAPHGNWHVMDTRKMTLTTQFDGIVSWNAFFHLSRTEQRSVLPQIAALLRPGGRLIITTGHRDGK